MNRGEYLINADYAAMDAKDPLTKKSKIAKCKKCGIESEATDSFVKISGSLLSSPKDVYCPLCSRDVANKKITLVQFAIAMLILMSGVFGWLTVNLVLLYVLLIPLIFLHELAHLGTALIFHFKVLGVMINSGKSLVKKNLFGISFTLNAIPSSGGYTHFLIPPLAYARLKFFLVVFSGPLFHLFSIATIILLTSSSTIQLNSLTGNFAPWSAFLAANILLLVLNIIPHRTLSIAATNIGNDGWQLIKIPRLRKKEVTRHFANFYTHMAKSYLSRGLRDKALEAINKARELSPEDPCILIDQGSVLANSGDYLVARAIFRKLLSEDDLSPTTSFINMNNLAWTDLVMGKSSLLAEADEYSFKAYRNMPWNTSVMGTRGAVLVALGNLDDGEELLKQALSKNSDDPISSADCFYWLAMAEEKRGNRNSAIEFLRQAKDLDHDSKLFLKTELSHPFTNPNID